MKKYFSNVLNRLQNFSLSLDKTSILVDKPWALLDDKNKVQKLIFKKNNELILSKNGEVQDGTWEYFPEAKSLLINRNGNKILCQELFIDHNIMILKLDGTTNQYFILANQNIIPDLDTERYLIEAWWKKFNITQVQLLNGKVIEIHREPETYNPKAGNIVTFEAQEIEDGNYLLANSHLCYEIKGGKIQTILSEYIYTKTDGQDIYIHQHNNNGIGIGDYVFINEKVIADGIVDFLIDDALYDNSIETYSSDVILSIEVYEGKIHKILSNKTYQSIDGRLILIKQIAQNKISKGDYVYSKGLPLSNAEIQLSCKTLLKIENGEIVNIKSFTNKTKGLFSRFWKK